MTGYTDADPSGGFPIVGGVQGGFVGGTCRSGFQCNDAFVAKLSADGSTLVYSTPLGGSSDDYGNGIAVDAAGNAYVTGYTQSSDFPTAHPSQGTCDNCNATEGIGDAFVAKLNAAGSALVYSTYLGGSSDDVGAGIAVDSSGNAYVTGWTSSIDFPTASPFQPTNRAALAVAGDSTAFVTELNPTGSALIYSTYLGGSGADSGSGIAVDSSGNAYVTGWTASTDFPTASPFQPTNKGALAPPGHPTAFVTELNPTGSALIYSTYLGGSGGDSGSGIAVDSSGNAYVTGWTASTDFPTAQAIQSTCDNCNASNWIGDAFLAKLNTAGSALVYSTYLGGSNDDGGSAIALDSSTNAYVTGWTSSADFPTANPFQASFGGYTDAFVAKISPNTPLATSSLAVVPSTVPYGGTVTLSATLTSAGAGISGESITFSVNATEVGTASTDSSGFATLTVACPRGINAGTYPGYIKATFVGDAKYAGSSGTSTLTVTQATTSLAVAPATGTYGGTLTLSATLTSGGSGVTGEPISLSLNGTAVGTASTNASGVATLSVSLSGYNAGNISVGANFAGDTNYLPSSGGSSLTVTPAPTTLTVSGSGIYGGTASVSATLTSGGVVVPDGLISFTANGVNNTATTNSAGVATLTGVPLGGINAGTYANSVSANFGGNTNYLSSSGTGSLTVGQASSATVIAPSSVSLGQTVALTATVTSPAGTVNDGQVTFHFDVTVTVGSTSIPETVQQTEPVRNGIAVFPYSPTGVNPEATTMVASFSGSTNFHNSNGSASLSIMPYAADLALTGLTISPTLQPQTATDDYHFTIGAQVTNLGPSPANDGLVSIWATDATGATFGAQYVELRNSFPANVTSLQANGSVTVPVPDSGHRHSSQCDIPRIGRCLALSRRSGIRPQPVQ